MYYHLKTNSININSNKQLKKKFYKIGSLSNNSF